MSEFLGRLSSYNLLNYLLTGAVFAVLAKSVYGWGLVPEEPVLAGFVLYFIGLVVSRIGSLILEPLLWKTSFAARCEHEDYVRASRVDPSIATLNEANNVYRTLLAAMLLLLGMGLADALTTNIPWRSAIGRPFALVLLAVLFLLSYRKQTAYIVSHVSVARADAMHVLVEPVSSEESEDA